MKRGFRPRWMMVGVFLLAISLLGAGCATKQAYKPAGPVDCGAKIHWTVAKEASVTMFKCYIDRYKKKFPSIHYTIGIKNVSDKPQRYRINIFIPEGRAVGGLLPRKGKPPLLAPGKEAKFTYPMKNYNKIPTEIDVVVKTISH